MQKRTRFLRGALESCHRQDIPVAWGEKATTKPRPVASFEFDCDFMAKDVVFTPYGQPKSNPENSLEIESGITLLSRLVKSIIETPDGQPRNPRPEEKLNFLLISSLADIWTFVKLQPENFVKATSRIVLQGGYTVEPNPSTSSYTLVADPMANNNGGFDMDSANKFHEFMCVNKIPSVVYTKVAATASALPPKVLEDMAATGHVLGQHLYKVQALLDLKYYEDSGDDKKRFREHMDQRWFLGTRTNWFLSHAENDPYPKGAEVLEYVMVVFYDGITVFEVAGPDVLDALNILKPCKDQTIHRIVGKRAPDPKTNDPGDIGVNIPEMQMALKALCKGCLMTVQESL